MSLQAFAQADFQDPLIASAEYKSAAPARPVGREGGPVRLGAAELLVRHDPLRPERSDPHQRRRRVGVRQRGQRRRHRADARLDQALPVAVRADELWQGPDYNQYHLNYENRPARPRERRLRVRDPARPRRRRSAAATARGRASTSTSRRRRSRTTRPSAPSSRPTSTTRPNAKAPSTGIVYWQLNKGWPTLLWDLYNYDFDQAGSYFGAKKANEPLHVLYAYDTAPCRSTTSARATQSGLSVQAKVYDIDGKLLDDQTAQRDLGASAGRRTRVAAPGRARGHRRRRRRRRRTSSSCCCAATAAMVDRNVYWLSTQQDIVNWPKTIGNSAGDHDPVRRPDGRCTSCRSATRDVTARSPPAPGPDGADTLTDVTITNTSRTPTVGVLPARRRPPRGSRGVRRGRQRGAAGLLERQRHHPVAGGVRDADRPYRRAALQGYVPAVTVSGWNVAVRSLGAG